METKQIRCLKINSHYSLSGKDKLINLSERGILNLDLDSLSAIRNLSNLEKIKTISEYYANLRCLNITGSLNYTQILGNKKSKEYSLYLKSKIEESLKLVNDYHSQIFPLRKQCYNNLTQVSLDDQLLEVPVYNHAGVTGRTSITSGYNFLTMKKNKRQLLKSLKKDHTLVEVDFKSCEPFFYLKSNGFNIESVRDVYHWISQNYEVKIKSRDKFKRGILSMLYGANEYTTSKVMQIDMSVVKRIKSELGINDLNVKLENEFNENGFIKNYYGRPVTNNNNLVNYWIQSSAVDFCSLAFYDFYKNCDLSPCFFIHDSMTFEIHKSRISAIKEINEILEPISNISIPVEFNILN